MKLLIFLIFISSFVFAEECLNPVRAEYPGNTKFIEPIGGVKCVVGETDRDLSKKEICNCQIKNKNLNLKASPKYKEVDKKFGKKQLTRFIDQFKTNMTTTIDNAFSVTQFVGGNTTLGSCNEEKLRKIEKKCKGKDSIYSKYFPDKSPFDGFLDQLKEEYIARLKNEKRTKSSGGYIVKRGTKKSCDMSDAAGYYISGMRGQQFAANLIELYKSNNGSGSMKSFLEKFKLEKSSLEKLGGKDYQNSYNYMSQNPAFDEFLHSDKPFLGINEAKRTVKNSAQKIAGSCKKAFKTLKKVLCMKPNTKLTGKIDLYKDIGMKGSKVVADAHVQPGDEKNNKIRQEKEFTNNVLAEHMCRYPKGIDISDRVSSLEKLLESGKKKTSSKRAKENNTKTTKKRYQIDTLAANKNICPFREDIKKAIKDKNCTPQSMSMVCMDLLAYDSANSQDRMFTKLGENGEPVLDDRGNAIEYPNPNYISFDDTIQTLYGPESFVGSFFYPDKKSQKKATASKETASFIASNTVASNTAQGNRRTSISNNGQRNSDKVSSLSSANTSTNFNNSGAGSFGSNEYQKPLSTKEKRKRISKNSKKLIDKIRNSYKPRNFNTRTPASSSQVTAPTSVASSNSSSQFLEDNIIDEKNVPGTDFNDTTRSVNNAFNEINSTKKIAKTQQGSGGKSISGKTSINPINSKTGERDNRVEISSVGDIPELLVTGDLKDYLLSISPDELKAKRTRLTRKEKEKLLELKKIIAAKEDFFISKEGDKRYRFLLSYNVVSRRYEIVDSRSGKDVKDYESFNSEEYDRFKKIIIDSLNTGAINNIVQFEVSE